MLFHVAINKRMATVQKGHFEQFKMWTCPVFVLLIFFFLNGWLELKPFKPV